MDGVTVKGRLGNGESFEDIIYAASNLVNGQYRERVYGYEDTIITVDLFFCLEDKQTVLDAIYNTAGTEITLELSNKWVGVILNPSPVVTNQRGQFQIPISFLVTAAEVRVSDPDDLISPDAILSLSDIALLALDNTQLAAL
jgi:hypothetical protein